MCYLFVLLVVLFRYTLYKTQNINYHSCVIKYLLQTHLCDIFLVLESLGSNTRQEE